MLSSTGSKRVDGVVGVAVTEVQVAHEDLVDGQQRKTRTVAFAQGNRQMGLGFSVIPAREVDHRLDEAGVRSLANLLRDP